MNVNSSHPALSRVARRFPTEKPNSQEIKPKKNKPEKSAPFTLKLPFSANFDEKPPPNQSIIMNLDNQHCTKNRVFVPPGQKLVISGICRAEGAKIFCGFFSHKQHFWTLF